MQLISHILVRDGLKVACDLFIYLPKTKQQFIKFGVLLNLNWFTGFFGSDHHISSAAIYVNAEVTD